MGWCSATEIMDTALAAAEASIEATLDVIEFGVPLTERQNGQVDDSLRSFVAKLATVLRDNDWDCIEESDYFDRFPQEMLGHNDSEHLAWLVENIKYAADDEDHEGIKKWTDALDAFKQKTENKA